MMRLLPVLLLLAALVAGCAGAGGGGTPKAVAPVTEHNFGDVLTTADVKTKEFVIKNEGKGDLKISAVQVKMLEGC